MKKVSIVGAGMLLGLVLAAGPAVASSCHGGADHGGVRKDTKKAEVESFTATVYACPMHPGVRSDDPGACPQCGMTLEAKQVTGYRVKNSLPEATKAVKKGEKKVLYTCPMHPEVQSDKPGKCPQCGMTLEAHQTTGSGEPAKENQGKNRHLQRIVKMRNMPNAAVARRAVHRAIRGKKKIRQKTTPRSIVARCIPR